MKKKMSSKEQILIASMLFGMFFGAGNLIFPASLGVSAGSNTFAAFLGLFISAVGLPLLAVVALGLSKTSGVVEMSEKAGKKYAIFFSTLLYLTIGPLFAVPRCASTSFTIGAVNLIGDLNEKLALAVFSVLFFAAVLFFSLRPGKIMTWIGKILNPTFLVLLFFLIITALINPIASLKDAAPAVSYATKGSAFFTGFLEGYNTLDALAGLAFGIVVVNAVRDVGVEDAKDVASGTARAGIFSCLFMGIVYLLMTVVAAQSATICKDCANGGEVLGVIANAYFGKIGAVLLFGIVTLACLKTAVGLVTSCAAAFEQMFPKGPNYKSWAIIFTVVSIGVANLGLSSIVTYCIPVLMFIYPLAIALIILSLTSKLFNGDKKVYQFTIYFTMIAAIFDFCNTLASIVNPEGAFCAVLTNIASVGAKILPFFKIGLGWFVPGLIGFLIGYIMYKTKK